MVQLAVWLLLWGKGLPTRKGLRGTFLGSTKGAGKHQDSSRKESCPRALWSLHTVEWRMTACSPFAFRGFYNLLNNAVTGRWGIEEEMVPQLMLKRPKPLPAAISTQPRVFLLPRNSHKACWERWLKYPGAGSVGPLHHFLTRAWLYSSIWACLWLEALGFPHFAHVKHSPWEGKKLIWHKQSIPLECLCTPSQAEMDPKGTTSGRQWEF